MVTIKQERKRDYKNMNLKEFEELTQKVKAENPKWFGMESDCIPTVEDIELLEKYYGIRFPDNYKAFILQYGGGYFAFTIVYSIDKRSPFYIKNNVEVEFVKEKNFLPIIDLETGDMAGVKINNGICEELMALYDHEENVIIDLNLDLFDALAKYGFKSEIWRLS